MAANIKNKCWQFVYEFVESNICLVSCILLYPYFYLLNLKHIYFGEESNLSKLIIKSVIQLMINHMVCYLL